MAARILACKTAEGTFTDMTQRVCKDAGLLPVRVPLDGYGSFTPIMTRIREWLESDAAQGEVMFTNLIDGMWRPNMLHAYFTDDHTAFAFKMQFG